MRMGFAGLETMQQRWIPGVVACLLVVGCGRSSGTVPVTGRVAIGGQPPTAECVVMFVPHGEADGPLRAGKAVCDEQGSFSATTFRLGDGLVPGRYRALVRCVISGSSESAPPVSLVPAGYEYPVFDVPGDSPRVELTIDVPSPEGTVPGGSPTGGF